MSIKSSIETQTLPAEAHCTWGDGPDVLVFVKPIAGFRVVEHTHGEEGHSFGLSSSDALKLAQSLKMAADLADSYRDTFNHRRLK